MSVRIGVDVGGTFTDVFVVADGVAVRGKSDTTAYDLKVGFFNAVSVAAAELGRPLEAVLGEAESIVYSTTIGTNALIEHRGPRLGLITTSGFEDTVLIGRGRSWADGLPTEAKYDRGRARRPVPLVPRHLIVGVRERLDMFGKVLMPIMDEDVLGKVQSLVDQGVRGFVVVLLYSYVNPAHERRVRDLIRAQYPEAYLGHMPVFLSSEVSPQMGEYRRTMTCILDAFLRLETENHLVSLTDELRDAGYRRPFLVAKCTGGASSLSRTRPIHLFGSGPVSGIIGASVIARAGNVPNTLVTDMGGTSFDLGLIVEGRERTYEYDPIIDRWRVQVPLVAHWSIGAGGGSIARVENGILKVGPQSARALPGPACYARGGEEPTVTDADVVLGYVDPAYFLGGRIVLDAARAGAALRAKVAEPLGMDLHTAAWSVKQLVDGTMGQEIYRITALTSGLDPREFTLFALGGAGPVHAAGYAVAADVPRCATFPFGSVFGAFGALNLDILQTYEKTHSAIFFSSQTQAYNAEAVAPFNASVRELLEIARRDMEEEGFDLSRLTFQLELLMRFGQQRHTLPVDSPKLNLAGEEDVRWLVERFVKAYADAYGQGAVFLEAGVELLGLRLNAVATTAKPPLPRATGQWKGAEPKGTRTAYWGPADRFAETPVYQREEIGPDIELRGPALIESEDTVCVLPPGWRFRLDNHLVGWTERA